MRKQAPLDKLGIVSDRGSLLELCAAEKRRSQLQEEAALRGCSWRETAKEAINWRGSKGETEGKVGT